MNIITKKEIDKIYRQVGLNPDHDYLGTRLNTGTLQKKMSTTLPVSKVNFNPAFSQKNAYTFR